MKIVILDGYTANPGDLSWQELESFGELTVYDRTRPEETVVLSLHCPLTDDTHHLINNKTLSQMKSTAILINTGRGPLVDDQAVADALEKGAIAAYCADVLTEEPPKRDNPLLKQPNTFITPHIAWATKEARSRLIQVAIGNVRSFLNGKPQNVVGFIRP